MRESLKGFLEGFRKESSEVFQKESLEIFQEGFQKESQEEHLEHCGKSLKKLLNESLEKFMEQSL